MKPLDDEIRDQFADLAAEDELRAPQFSSVWSEATHRAPSIARPVPTSRRWWFLAAASVLIAVTLAIGASRAFDERAEAAQLDASAYPSILSWTAPTDGLLISAQQAVARPPATFGSSLDTSNSNQ